MFGDEKEKYNLAVRQYSGVCAVRVLPQREIRRGGSGRLFRGEHRTFDIRYVPRTHGEHLVRADGAGGAHDFRDRDKQRHRFVRSDALREHYYRHCADYSCLYDMQEEVCGLFRRRSEAGAVCSARRAFYNGLRHDAQQHVHPRRT